MIATNRSAADLGTQIEACWSVPSKGQPGTEFLEFFPDCCANLIFRISPTSCRLVLLGPVTETASVELDTNAEYFGIRFRTGQTPRLADVRASELTNSHLELTSLGGLRVELLAERFRSRPDFAARQQLMEELVRGLPPLVRDARCRNASRLLEARGGQVRIEDLSEDLGLHARSLERLFQEHLGISPKRLSRLVRLRRLLVRLHAGEFEDLAALAQEEGYSDQPHMIRDFKALTGRLPGEKDSARPRRLEEPGRAGVVHRHRP